MLEAPVSAELVRTRDSLELRGIIKSFGGVQALNGANLTCGRGEVHGLIGENGAGKSTLVKVLSGVVLADAGEITLDGAPLRLRSPLDTRGAGIVTAFQELSLVADLSVASNLFYGIEPKVRAGRIDLRALRRQAAAALEELGVEGIDPARNARQLSLAERQLLEISRALILRPKVLVLDEPTSALLPEQVQWLFKKVREFDRDRGDHAVHLASSGGNRAAVRKRDRLPGGKGRRKRRYRRDARKQTRRAHDGSACGECVSAS